MENNLNYTKVLLEFFKKFPEFKETKYYAKEFKDLPYLMMDFFGQYLVELIEKETLESSNEKFIEKGFEFTNYLFESKDPEVVNLAGVAIIENIAGSMAATSLGYKHLNTKGVKALKDMFK